VWWFEIQEWDFDLFSLVPFLCREKWGGNVCSGDKDVVLEEFGLRTLVGGGGEGVDSIPGDGEGESFDFVARSESETL